MGSGMTGFLAGFTNMQQKLQELDETRSAKQQQLALQKETLKLQQQRLKGEEAHTVLENKALEAKLAQALRETQGQEQFGRLFAQGQDPNDPAIRQQMLATAAQYWAPEQLLKLHESFRARDDMALLNQAGIMPSGPGGAAPAPGAVAPPLTAVPGASLSPAFRQKAQQVASRLGMQPNDLMQIMHFETGGTFNPAEPNKAGSGATGLIQFMPETAKALGTTTQALAQMTPEAQLDYVEKYLTPYKGKLGTMKDAYMAVLNPSAIGQAPETVLWKNGTPAYAQNIGLDKDDKGFITVGDAVNAVQGGRAPGGAVAPQGGAGADVARLEQQRAVLQQQVDQIAKIPVTSEKGLAERNRLLDNTRQALTQTLGQLTQARIATHQQQQEARQTREEQRKLEPEFDKDFAAYFALHHNNQRPQDALKAPGGPQVVQQAQAAYDTYTAERDATKVALKEQAQQPFALERAKAAKAAVQISPETVKAIAAHTSVYESIDKVATILREGTDLPPEFVDLVSQGGKDIQRYLQGNQKALTGLLQQYKTRWGAAASNDPRVNRFLSALGNMRDLVLQARSGAAVSPTELDRAISAFSGSLPDISQAFSLFAENMANVKENSTRQLVILGSSVRPLSGGDVVYGGLPDAVKLQILRNEARALEPVVPPGAVGGDVSVAPRTRRVIGEPVEVQ